MASTSTAAGHLVTIPPFGISHASLNDLPDSIVMLIIKMIWSTRYYPGHNTMPYLGRTSNEKDHIPISPFSMVNKRVRSLCIPVMFANIAYHIEPSKFRQELLDMQINKTILNSVTRVSMLKAADETDSCHSSWAVQPFSHPENVDSYPADTAPLLWNTIAKMPNLTRLLMRYWDDANNSLFKSLRSAIKGFSGDLPTVKTLYTNSEDELIDVIEAWTALQTLSTIMNKKWKTTMQAASAVKTLVCLELDRRQVWEVKHVDGMGMSFCSKILLTNFRA